MNPPLVARSAKADIAVGKLVEITNEVEAVQDGIYVKRANATCISGADTIALG
jgi:hypothetical protein